jgi:hypothetical protein
VAGGPERVSATLTARIRTALLRVEGMVESPSIFEDGDAFWVNGKQIANFIGPDEDALGLRLGRPMISAHRARLKQDPRVDVRRSGSDWIIVRFSAPADLPFVLELAELTASAYRAAPGTTAKPPPVGTALERMRRFH